MKKNKWISVIGLLLICTLVLGSISFAAEAPAAGEEPAVTEDAGESQENAASEGEAADSEGESGDSEGESEEAAVVSPFGAPVPLTLPPELAGLETVEAQPWLQVYTDRSGIEGPAFDAEGNLYFCDTSPMMPENHILKIGEDQQIETIWTGSDNPVGLAFDADGKLYASCMTGVILKMDKDGSNVETIVPQYEGEPISVNDLVFTAQGNLYVTDWRGTIADPVGGVYLLTKDSGFTEAVQLVGHLPSPNGISLSPAGDTLWIGVSAGNYVLKITLAGEGVVSDILGVLPVYYNTGSDGPDSNKTDSAGNLYQAFMPGGRLLVFDSTGVPIRNIIIPERSEGRLTMSSNLIIKPGTTEGYFLTAGFGDGTWIYSFEALAPGH